MIQPRPQRESELSDQYANFILGTTQLNPNDVAHFLNIILSDDGVWFIPKKCGHIPFKLVEVFFRPTYFHFGIGQSNSH